MKNKHKFWLLIALIILLAAVAYSITPTNNTNTPNLTNNSSEIQQSSGLFGGGTTGYGSTDSKRVVQAKDCPECKGTGQLDCRMCGGNGVEYRCNACGLYWNQEGPCPNRNDPTKQCTGWITPIDCSECGGTGLVKCDNCGGDGKIN